MTQGRECAPPIVVGIDEQTRAVALVTLDRPARRNAMSAAMVDAAIAWLTRAAYDPAIAAVVLSGAGTGFCAGSDLAGLATMDDAGRSAFEYASGQLARLLRSFPRPVVAAVHGYAIGGGLTLAAACDIVVTTPDAKWSLPEVPIGLFPAWGLEAVTLRIGTPRARRLSWGIDTLNGEEAGRIGLADMVCADPLVEALGIARRLSVLPRAQAESVKHYFAAAHGPEDGDGEANALFMAACDSDEALASFEKFGRKRAHQPNAGE